MTAFDVIGFGALNVDKQFRVNRLAAADQESYVTSFEENCGGSAGNTAIGLARLGCRVGFIGKVANDREGKMLLEDFRREGVDTSAVTTAKRGRSGTAMAFVDRDGQRALYVDPGVNDIIQLKEIRENYVSRALFLHLTSFVGEKSFQTQKNLLEAIPEETKISFDPGELYARRGLTALKPIISKAYVMMPNEAELRLLTGKTDYCRGALYLLELGVKVVAVKLGDRGCYVADKVGGHVVEPFKVKAVDSTGAGDAFCAGFLFGLIKGKNLDECGRIANFVASRCVMKMGARAGLPYLKDLKLLR